MTCKPSRLRVWAGRLTLVLFSSLLCLIALELFARKFLVAENISHEVWDGFHNTLVEGRYVPDPELGYVPGPNWSEGQGRLGCLNGAEFDLSKKNRDLLLLGDSLLQSRICERAVKNRLEYKGFRVWTVGIGGYNTLQEALYFEKYVTLKPETVVLEFCMNDFLPPMVVVSSDKWNRGEFAFNTVHPLSTVSPFLFKNSALYRFIKIKSIAKDTTSMYSADFVRKNRKLVIEGLQKLKDVCARGGSGLYVIVYPHLSNPEKEWEAEARKQILQILPEMNIPFVDVHDEYYAHGIEKLRQDKEDTVHPNLTGHRIATKKLFDTYGAKMGVPENDIDRPWWKPAWGK